MTLKSEYLILNRMKKNRKFAFSMLIFGLLSNLPIFSGILTAIFVGMKGNQFGFITKDLHFFMAGGIEVIQSSENYLVYKKRYPKSNHTLYRFSPRKNYLFFWRYGEYITDPNWRAPYIDLPPNFSDVKYYGDDRDDEPSYKWDEQTEQWVKIAPH